MIDSSDFKAIDNLIDSCFNYFDDECFLCDDSKILFALLEVCHSLCSKHL